MANGLNTYALHQAALHESLASAFQEKWEAPTVKVACKVYYGLPKTRGVSETGHAGSGTVVHFGTPQHTAYPYRGVAGIHGYISKVICNF